MCREPRDAAGGAFVVAAGVEHDCTGRSRQGRGQAGEVA